MSQFGVITEQADFGFGTSFKEASAEEKDRYDKSSDTEDDQDKDSKRNK